MVMGVGCVWIRIPGTCLGLSFGIDDCHNRLLDSNAHGLVSYKADVNQTVILQHLF